MKDIVIIPTYNEKENVANIISRVSEMYPMVEIWIVDDSSPDGTGRIVADLARSNPQVKLYSRKQKSGLGDAYKYILSIAQKDKNIRHIVTMDADGSHPVEKIGDLMEALKDHDLTIGSRYIRGGHIVGWGLGRFFLSYFGNIYNRLITGLRIKDCTAGFMAFRRDAIDKIDFSSISGAGYAYQLEFKNIILKQGGRHCEIPITFTDRRVGQSKMSGHIIAEGLLMPWRILVKDREKIFSRLLALGVLFFYAVAIFFAFFHLAESPPFWFDEGWYFQTAANLASAGIDGIQLAPGYIQHISVHVTVGYPLIFALALWFKVFGISIFTGRLLLVIFTLSFLVVAYIVSRRSFGVNKALAVLALLATFPPLFGNGKSVLGEMPGIFYLSLFLLFYNISRSATSKKMMWLFLSGIFAGLCIATKPLFLVLLPALAVGLFIEWRRKILSGKQVGIFIFCLILPIIVWFIVQFPGGVSLPTLFSYYANPYNEVSLIQKVFLNIKKIFSDVGTLYTVFLMAVWSLAILFKLRKHERINGEEIVAYIFSLLTIFAFLRTGGLYRYLFPTQVIGLIFFPDSLSIVLRNILSKYTSSYLIRRMIMLVVTALTVLGLYQLIFDSWVAQSYSSKKTAYWQEYFDTLPATTTVFFYNTPEVSAFIHSRNYYQFILAPAGSSTGPEQLSVLRKGTPDIVIVETTKFKETVGGVFDRYSIKETAYKYSILEKKKNL